MRDAILELANIKGCLTEVENLWKAYDEWENKLIELDSVDYDEEVRQELEEEYLEQMGEIMGKIDDLCETEAYLDGISSEELEGGE